MRARGLWIATAVVALLVTTAPVAAAAQADDELWIAAAARTDGADGSFWSTDLYIRNLAEDAVTVELTWLDRWADNSQAEPVQLFVGAGETVAIDDVVSTLFGRARAAGAIRIAADEDAEGRLIATARISNPDDGATYGQGMEGRGERAAITAGGSAVTHVVGIGDSGGFRTNWFGLNVSENADGEAVAASVMVEMLDEDGDVVAAKTYTMPPLAPVLHPLTDVGGGTAVATALRFTMIEGTGLFGASKIDGVSNDPTTLSSHWDPDACSGVAGEAVEIEEARLYVEYNATDGDLGVHGSFDHEGWTQLCVSDPTGDPIASLRPKGEAAELGFAEVFFESEEPEIDEFSFDDLRTAFPEGEYPVRGVTIEGEGLTGAAWFTHDVPQVPVITSPAGMIADPEEEEPPVVAVDDVVVSWNPVTALVDGGPAAITAYQVIVTNDEVEDPHGFSQPIYSVHVGPGVTSLPVPTGFLESDTVYEVEVLALEVSGNQTIGLGFFRTP